MFCKKKLKKYYYGEKRSRQSKYQKIWYHNKINEAENSQEKITDQDKMIKQKKLISSTIMWILTIKLHKIKINKLLIILL